MKFDNKLKLAALSGVCALVAAGVAIAQTAPGAAAPGAAPAARAPNPNAQNSDPATTGYRPQSTINGVVYPFPAVEDTLGVLDNLPATAPAKPKKARKVLVFSRSRGFAHSSIPLTAFAVREMGLKTGAWETTITYNPDDINTANLARFDVLVLNNTTGAFLDDDNAAATAARKAALLAFVRGGKGLTLLHAATDSYRAQGKSTWPEWSHIAGGFFKFHWNLPQEVTVRIDDPKSPLNAGFGGKSFVIHDEIYTVMQDEFSTPKNYHVLTSVDYSKMSDADKAKETAATRRTDGHYRLSSIQKEGEGRVYNNVLGHSEHVLTNPAILQQVLAGIQYAAGDLAAPDAPSAK